MIQSIEFRDLATFVGPHQLFGLNAINYLFGGNGTGKSTISKAIAEGDSTKCQITWAGNIPLERIVYNEDWIKANFSQTEELKGIFTLGEQEINLGNQIEEARERCDTLREDIATIKKNRDGDPANPTFEGEVQKQAALDGELTEECWTVKKKNEAKYKDAMRGSLQKAGFKNRAVLEVANNKCKTVDAVTLPERVKIVFGPKQDKLQEIARPCFAKLAGHEAAPILSKIVVGKKDVDVARMIQKLGNSDWVKQGVEFFKKNPEACPFCQQAAPASLKESLDAYFDQTFLADSELIRTLKANYSAHADAAKQELDLIEQGRHQHLNLAAFKQAKKALDVQVKTNLDRIQKKQEESSRVIALDAIKDATEAVLALIDAANGEIKRHNNMIDDRDTEQQKVETEVWKLMLDDGLSRAVEDYEKKKAAIDKAKKGMTERIAQKERDLRAAEIELAILEKKMTSVEPTVKEINMLLEVFGFRGFKLAMTTDKKSYKLIRANGESAKHTLSEGEKTFVTFLYFYHLLKGSRDGANVSAARIVVFDDPVSSLDSDVLHIVSSLIRELFVNVCAGMGALKQVFILTHNIAFHKEVSYFKKRHKGVPTSKITYWKVYKQNEQSSVLFSRTNPVKSHYEVLWAEIGRKNPHTICNTLRRILEQASKLLGGIELGNLEKKFSGGDLTACRTLLGWVHDGSHFSFDDMCMTVDNTTIDMYLNVFRDVFKHSGWEAHYEHMMAIEQVGEATKDELAEQEELANVE
ncbi:MAG TPA: AAA family ATPase [Gemmataceae bacterium]|nr:AAA family ATPase [Gemmataceae bacterium]